MSQRESGSQPPLGSQRESDDSEEQLPAKLSATSVGANWATRIMTISMGMVAPGLAGYWLDSRLGTKVVFMLIGFALGSVYAMVQLLAIARRNVQRNSPQEKRESAGSRK